MPKALDQCVTQLLAKWSKNPKDRPTPRDKKQDAKSQAFALCSATLKKAGKLSDVEYVEALIENGDSDIAGRVALLTEFGFSEEVAAETALADRESNRSKTSGLGPALKGIALTIIPFIKRQEEASVIEEGEDKLVRIPVIRSGKWRHPIYGVLRFDSPFFEKMVKNFNENVVGQRIPVKSGHEPREQHALAWVEKLAVEGENLVAYARATGDKVIDIVSSKKAPYASAEFESNFRDREMKPMSFMGLEEVEEADEGIYEFSDEELEFIELEDKSDTCECREEMEMPEDKEKKEVQTISLEEVKKLQDRLQVLEQEAKRVDQLETSLAERDQRITELEIVNESAMVAHILERAKTYTDGESRAHSALFLNTLEAALTMSAITQDEETIVALSDEFAMTEEAAEMRDYFRGVLRFLAENLPGSVPVEGGTEPLDQRDVAPGVEEEDEDLGADLWDETPEREV